MQFVRGVRYVGRVGKRVGEGMLEWGRPTEMMADRPLHFVS